MTATTPANTDTDSSAAAIRVQEYEARLRCDRLRREVFQQTDPAASPSLLEELAREEATLQELERRRRELEGMPRGGLILDSTDTARQRGTASTGLSVRAQLNMAHVPTSFYHVLDGSLTPLLTCEVQATQRVTGPQRRIRVTSFIDGYSAKAIDTFEVEVGRSHTFTQLPTLFPGAVNTVNELTRATLNVLVEDLDGKVEMQETHPIWLLARTCAPLAVLDPQTGDWRDLTMYLGAFVTPNAPSVMTFLREAARQHPTGQLWGYQGTPNDIEPQVKALFDALKATADITYVNSLVTFNPQQGFSTQRVRLPRESLLDKQANCIDGTVLFASLLEGISMRPAIVLVPGHAFVAWETWTSSGEWRYLETTMIGTSTFEQACLSAETTAKHFAAAKQLRLLPLVQLRSKLGITPME